MLRAMSAGDGFAGDSAWPVVQSQECGHRDGHDDSRPLAEEGRLIRALDVDVVALGRLAVFGQPLQDCLRARSCTDEDVEHQLADRTVICP